MSQSPFRFLRDVTVPAVFSVPIAPQERPRRPAIDAIGRALTAMVRILEPVDRHRPQLIALLDRLRETWLEPPSWSSLSTCMLPRLAEAQKPTTGSWLELLGTHWQHSIPIVFPAEARGAGSVHRIEPTDICG